MIAADLASHDLNAELSALLSAISHLPLAGLRYTRIGDNGTISISARFPTLDTYEQACAALRTKPQGSRTTGSGARILETVTKTGVLLEHVCFPHHPCWEGR